MANALPDGCIHVVIEIPRGSRNKYEIDHDTNRVYLDRRLFTATTYPVWPIRMIACMSLTAS